VLDGIDTLPIGAQSNLLRVIEEPPVHARRDRHWRPLGVRLISVSQTDPTDGLAGGSFLEPLLFRLNATHLRVPPLAEREGDLYMLVCHFLREFTPPSRSASDLTPGAWEALSAYGFPGNIRELAWAIEHAVTAADGGEIERQHLPQEVRRA
jgi:DNA-binding NtrC family response regulator